MNYNEYMANIKAYRNGTLMQAAPTDALSDWHEKYFDTAVSALSKKMIADHVEHSEDADKFGKDFVSLVAILEEDGVSKQNIGKELEAVSKAAQSQADAAIKKIDSVQHSTDTLEAYKENHLEHGEWKRHKYIRIENGRYIYPEDDAKLRSSSKARNFGPNGRVSAKGADIEQKAMENQLKAAGRSIGENIPVNEKNMNLAADAARSEAAKKYANDLTDKMFETGKSFLTGNKEAEISIDSELQDLIEKNKVEVTAEQYDEIRNMAATQTIRRLDDFVKENGSQKLKNEWENDKKELEKFFKTNRPFANRAEEINNLEKPKRLNHYDPRAAFYAAVDEYKENHLEHGGKWKDHKYIRIENGRYIYPEDVKKGSIGAEIPAYVKAKRARQEETKKIISLTPDEARKRAAELTKQKEQQTRQEETKKITSLTPDEARKRAAELTKQNTPEKKAEKNTVSSPTPEAPKAETPSNEDRVKTMMDAHHEELKKSVYDNYKKNAQEIIKGNGKYFSDLVTDPSKVEEYNTKRNEYVQACSNDMLSNYLFAKGVGLSNEEAKEYVVSILDDLNNSYKEGLKSKGYEADSEKSPFSIVFQETDHGTDKASVASLSISFDGRVKRIQHSDSRAAFYAAVDEYKSKKGLNQRVPL